MDKYEKRHGFVRYKKMEDERSLAIKLDIILDNRKIHDNIPRFQRRKKKVHLQKEKEMIKSIIMKRGEETI